MKYKNYISALSYIQIITENLLTTLTLLYNSLREDKETLIS